MRNFFWLKVSFWGKFTTAVFCTLQQNWSNWNVFICCWMQQSGLFPVFESQHHLRNSWHSHSVTYYRLLLEQNASYVTSYTKCYMDLLQGTFLLRYTKVSHLEGIYVLHLIKLLWRRNILREQLQYPCVMNGILCHAEYEKKKILRTSRKSWKYLFFKKFYS